MQSVAEQVPLLTKNFGTTHDRKPTYLVFINPSIPALIKIDESTQADISIEF